MQRDKTLQHRIQDLLLSCRVCDLQPVCLPWDLEPEDRRLLDHIVEHPRPLQKGEYLFRTGDTLQGVYAVRSGMFKKLQTDADGREQVLGFVLPGELVGVDGVHAQVHGSAAVALMESAICLLPYRELTDQLGRSERLRDQILRLAGGSGDARLSMAAQEGDPAMRLAAFLLDLSHRSQVHGGSASRFPFPLPEQDIASCLRLPLREVSRIFGQFQGEDLIARDGGDLLLRGSGRLADIAGSGR